MKQTDTDTQSVINLVVRGLLVHGHVTQLLASDWLDLKILASDWLRSQSEFTTQVKHKMLTA